MRYLLLPVFLILNVNLLNAQTFDWTQSAGGVQHEEGTAITTDAKGNIIAGGNFQSSTITFGSYTLTNHGETITDDIFLVKYDTSGNVLWARSAGGGSGDVVTAVKTDRAGNLFVSGYFYSTSILFENTTLYNSNPPYCDLFIAKYDPDGKLLWVKSVGGYFITEEKLFDMAFSIAADFSGNAYLTGAFRSSAITFGTTTLVNNGYIDIFLTKYDPDGNVIWAKSAGGPSQDFSYSVAVDDDNNPYITGDFWSSINFDSTKLVSKGNYDVFITKYDSSGNVLWAKSMGAKDADNVKYITADHSGGVFITGKFTLPSGDQVCLAKFNSNGELVWSKSTTSLNLTGYSAAFDKYGYIYLSGNQWAGLMGSDIILGIFDSSGNQIWSKTIGGSEDDEVFSIAVGTFGDAYVTGQFSSPSIKFGDANLIRSGDSYYLGDYFISKIHTGITSSASDLAPAPSEYLLANNFPNPFNPSTDIIYNIKKSGFVSLKVFNVLGREISRLVNEDKAAGEYKIRFDAINIPSGVYFYSLEVNGFSAIKKMILVK
ncbi:MAG: T9SS type A sorting domain-containing protein [Methanococcaceae archaeon]